MNLTSNELRRYIDGTNAFLDCVDRAFAFVSSKEAKDAPMEQLQKMQEALYGDILPSRYEEAFENPAYAVKCFGTAWGRFLSALRYELRTVIPRIYEKDKEGIDARKKLWETVLPLLKQTDVTEDASEAVAVFRAYFEERMPAERKRYIFMQIANDADLAHGIIQQEDLTDLRYLYRYGEYIGENELQTAAHLNSLSEEVIDRMARTFVDGYCEGFTVMNKDLSIKESVKITFDLGFERMVRRAMELFAERGLRSILLRAYGGIFCSPNDMPGSGYRGSRLFDQYEYDHKDDNALFLDEAFQKKRLEATRCALECYRKQARLYGGPAWIESFGREPFVPVQKEEAPRLNESQQKAVTEYSTQAGIMTNEFIPGDERSFTIISFPVPEIGAAFPEIFNEVITINTLDNALYRSVQQKIIDVLDQATHCVVRGMGENRTDMKVMLQPLKDPEKETKFENCVADVNIPAGEVFTSPQLKGTEGVLHVTGVYLNDLYYKDLSFTFQDGCVTDYSCANFDTPEEGRKYIRENVLYHHDTLPIGEFAIGTNTTAYVAAKKYHIEDKLTILIAEKTGPHFALGDTCYLFDEDTETFNPDGKRIMAKENEISARRKEDPQKAYFSCHTDITIPYDELGCLAAVMEDGREVPVIKNGRFVLEGTEPLNEAFTR